MDKQCFRCRLTKPLAEFYRHPRMADGHLNKCAECTRADVQENRAKRRDYYNASDKARHTPEKAKRATLAKRNQPTKQRARFALHNAVNRGKVKRLPCAVCGNEKAEAHHKDYSRPLDVVWLCRIHHGEAHRKDDSRRKDVEHLLSPF